MHFQDRNKDEDEEVEGMSHVPDKDDNFACMSILSLICIKDNFTNEQYMCSAVPTWGRCIQMSPFPCARNVSHMSSPRFQ
jgi:hypothetical protein